MSKPLENVIQQTTNYNQFSILKANRAVNWPHVRRLMKAIKEEGNMLKVAPILVNEKNEIIDGQHRFEAVKALNEKVYFSVVRGLDINDTRTMNNLARNWGLLDYAESFAKTGNKNYQEFLKMHESYPTIPLGLLVLVCMKKGSSSITRTVASGEFEIVDTDKSWQDLETMDGIALHKAFNKEYKGTNFWRSVYKIINRADYDNARMLDKIERVGSNFFRSYMSTKDNLRMLEDIYNYDVRNEENKARFF